ncbi:hypothetical protein ACJMK2_025584 [Sinanodonta woodiana]|uniref:Uncharacterized protein n=1 Tax=Sinanodonta woodiana TaxID=1069815 RepID=A0ABD3XKG0_SINWO
MKEMLKMRLPKTKVYFFLVAFSMGSVIFYISYQNASISANNISIRVTHLRNQNPGFSNQMLAYMRQSSSMASNDQQRINISHIIDTVAIEMHHTNSNKADFRGPKDFNKVNALIKMSKYVKGLNLTESINSELREDHMSWQEKGSRAFDAQKFEKTAQMLTDHNKILPSIVTSHRVEKGFLDLTMTENSNSGVTNIEQSFVQNDQSRSTSDPPDATNDDIEVKSDMTDQDEMNSSFTRVSKFSNSMRNNLTATNMTMSKSSNSVDMMLPSSAMPTDKNTTLSLPFKSPKSKDRNLKTKRILDKYKLSQENRYLPEINILKHPFDKSKKMIYLNSLVKKDMMEIYKNFIKNMSSDAFRQSHNSNKNYDTTLQLDSTMRPDACNDCFNQHYTYYLNPTDVCTGTRNVEILLMISSTPRNFEARNVIRKTWGSLCHNSDTNLGCVFLLGMNNDSDTEIMNAIRNEQEQYHDLLMANFTDSYANLTYKTMMGLKWAVDNCPLAQFIMKTDDDMYVNTELLPMFLKDAKPTKFMGGFCWAESSPHRNKNSKWYVSYQMYSNSRFPPMCSGTGYVMSRDTAEEVVQVSKNIPFFYLEDVYVALCLNQLRIIPKRLRGFNNVFVKFDPCPYRRHVITSHEVNPETLTFIWKSSRNCPMSRTHIIYEELPYF